MIAVDFDATLAQYYHDPNGHYNALFLGPPIPRMLRRVKRWLAHGHEVVIFTARVCERDPQLVHKIRLAFSVWCNRYVGQDLEVTCEKSPRFTEMWDDRAVSVEQNTGRVIKRTDVE